MNCPECAKEISDKSAVCIHCGYPIEKTSVNTAQSDGYVPDYHNDTTHPVMKQVTSKARWLYAILGLLVLLIAGTFGWYSYADQQNKLTHQTYQAGAYNLMADMLDTMENAEEMSKLNINAWHDAIDDAEPGDYVDFSTTEKYVWNP
jgi:hypothetical protein